MNCKISSDLDILDILNKKYNWIPGSNNIRPTEELILKKENDLAIASNFYESLTDYMYDLIFNFPTHLNSYGKLKVRIPNTIIKVFRENDYPYILPDNTFHYVMWYNTKEKIFSDELINKDIYNEILKLNLKSFEYVWYENPKMSVADIYHVQVFFIKKN